jgi:YD repeat-containing protein
MKRLHLFMLLFATGLSFLLDCGKHRQVAAEFQFNAAGNLVTSTGPDGKTSFQYDSRGLPIAVASSEGSARYGYDAHGNRIWIRDDSGSTEYYYDAFDRLSAVIWNRGPRRLLAYQYDNTGLPSRISVFNLQPLQSVPKFSEQIARLSTPSEPDSTNWHEREMVVLNLADQLRNAAAVENAPWLANDISYVRNLQGDLQEIRSEAGSVRFDRSADGRRVKRVLPNGIRSVVEYSTSGRISRLSHANSSGGEIASFTYNYDKVGRVQNVYGSEHGRPTKTDYVWDDHGRLQKMITDGVKFLYKYDASARCLSVVGDKKTVTYTFDPLGRLSKAKGVALDITPQRTISVLRGDGETTEIRYNDRGWPLEMITREAKLRYVWDGEGNLVSLKRKGKTVYFVPAAGTGIQLPLIQFDGIGTPESKLLISNSVLGEIHLGGTEFYLEGASGGACYLANGPRQRSNEFQRYVSKSPEPEDVPALVPARFYVSRIRARIVSGSLMLAQCTACQQHQAADEGWNLQLAQAQGWLQGIGGEILANQDILDRDAQSNLRRGGLWGLWGTVEAGESAVFYDLRVLSATMRRIRLIDGMTALGRRSFSFITC